MNEWLKVMLGEVARKKAEHAEALEEQKRRAAEDDTTSSDSPGDKHSANSSDA